MIVVVSDLHVGAESALLPPGFKTGSNEVVLNKRQRYLHACWLDFIVQVGQRCGKQKPHLVINGDLVQGAHPDKDGQLSLSTDVDQGLAVKQVLAPLLKIVNREAVFVIKGTEFHDAAGGKFAEDVAESIGARIDPDTGRRSRWGLWLEHEGKLGFYTHHASTAKGNPGTPMQRELQLALENKHKHGWPVPDYQVRSHVHKHRVVGDYDDERHIITTPAWQLHTAYGYKKDPLWLPDIGGLLLWVEDDNVRWKAIRYPFPKPRIET